MRKAPATAAIIGLVFGACERDVVPPQSLELDTLPTIIVTEELRIGSVDDANAGLTSVGNVAVDADGFVYVVERQEWTIKRYGADGRFIAAIGRRGDGPGEFAGVPRIGIHGDTLWAVEPFGRRITLFSRDGTVLDARRFTSHTLALHQPPVAPDPRVRVPRSLNASLVPFRMLSDGSFVTHLMPMAGAVSGQRPGSADTIRVPRLKLDLTGAALDTLGWELRPPPTFILPSTIQVGDLLFPLPLPPDDEPMTVPTVTGGFVIDRRISDGADAGWIRVTRLDLNGDTVFSRESAYRPNPYPHEHLDSLLTAATAGIVVTRLGEVSVSMPVNARSPSDAEISRARADLESAFTYPTHQVPVIEAHLGEDESLWLRREQLPGSPARWLVVSAAGDFVGHVLLDPGTRVHWTSGDVLWASRQDELGLAWLSRYRLMPSPY